MTQLWLKMTLESDAAFGRGDGVPGVVDSEVQHDEHGFVFMSGKTLKGLLTASCAEIMNGLEQAQVIGRWKITAQQLFGKPGSQLQDAGNLHIGDARLPAWTRQQIVRDNSLNREDVLDLLTDIRTQTAIDPVSGAPKAHSLRSIRVILHDTPLVSVIQHNMWSEDVTESNDDQLALLAACIKGLRRAGTSRNRGLGKIKLDLYDTNPFDADAQAVTETYFNRFKQAVIPQPVDDNKEDVPA